MIQTSSTILSIVEVINGAFLVRLEAPDIAAAAVPGQFVMVRCGGETVLPRPFSIHRCQDGSVLLLFAVVGEGTRWLSERKRGEKLDIFGPLGNGFSIHEEDVNLLLVAGGMGLAPLAFLAEKLALQGKTATVICGARNVNCLLPFSVPQSCYDAGLEPNTIHIVNITEDGSEGACGLATEFIDAYLVEKKDRIYACGPLPMYLGMAGKDYGIPVQVSLETVMGCGTGVCYGCTIRTKSGLRQVCKDGPVFDMSEIDWDSLKGK